MCEFSEGDCVRVDIPDTSDPDFDRYHGSHGEVREVLDDFHRVQNPRVMDEDYFEMVLEKYDDLAS